MQAVFFRAPRGEWGLQMGNVAPFSAESVVSTQPNIQCPLLRTATLAALGAARNAPFCSDG